MVSFLNYNNAEAAVIKLLKKLSINIDPAKVIAELDKHPDYPSLLAISDVLSNFDIDNSAFRIEADELGTIPCPFIAHTSKNGGDFMVVTRMDGNNVFVATDKWDNHKLPADEFKRIFRGIVLTAEADSDASPVSQTLNDMLNAIRVPAVAAGLLLVLGLVVTFHTGYSTSLSWQALALTVVKSAGLVVSILLLVQSIDNNNPLILKLCESAGSTDCNAILSSKAAKVFEGLSWSEVGFFYFAGTWLLLLFSGGSTALWQVLALLNFISLPYTVYSIYYQARVAKKWCVLCCTVQGLLWLEFIPLLLSAFKQPLALPGAREWATVIISLVSPVILWAMLKPMFLKMQLVRPLKDQLRKFKYSTELFNKLLTAQPKYTQPEEEWSVILGNVEANNIITMVTNPYCPPCAKTHKALDEWLDTNDDIQVRIVFTAQNTDDDRNTPISRHLMALNELPDKAKVKNALHDWYEQKQKDYKAWAKVYPVDLIEADFHKLDKQKAWCSMAEVIATPTLLLNGYRMPEQYQVQDLKYMLE